MRPQASSMRWVKVSRASASAITSCSIFMPSCGHCLPCATGRPALCEPGAKSNAAGTLLRGAHRIAGDGRGAQPSPRRLGLCRLCRRLAGILREDRQGHSLRIGRPLRLRRAHRRRRRGQHRAHSAGQQRGRGGAGRRGPERAAGRQARRRAPDHRGRSLARKARLRPHAGRHRHGGGQRTRTR